jgi:hypothetical protein
MTPEQKLLTQLRMADVALQAAVIPLADLGGNASIDLAIHRAPLSLIAIAKMIARDGILPGCRVASTTSTERDHVYDVVRIDLGGYRAAHLYGVERLPLTADEAKIANDGAGISGWCAEQAAVDAAQVAMLDSGETDQ